MVLKEKKRTDVLHAILDITFQSITASEDKY